MPSPRAEPIRHPGEVIRGIGTGRGRGRGAGDDHHVDIGRELVAELAATLAYEPLDAIPGHGVSDLAGHSDTKPGPWRHRDIAARPDEHQEVTAGDALATALDGQILAPFSKPPPGRKTLPETHEQDAASTSWRW